MLSRPRRGPAWAAALSLALHAAVLLAFILGPRHPPQPEELPPPSEVTMLFDTGRPEGPRVPNPQPFATPNSPESAPTPPEPAPTPPEPAPTPPEPALAPPPEPPPVAAQPPEPTPPPAASAPPAPAPPSLAEPAPPPPAAPAPPPPVVAAVPPPPTTEPAVTVPPPPPPVATAPEVPLPPPPPPPPAQRSAVPAPAAQVPPAHPPIPAPSIPDHPSKPAQLAMARPLPPHPHPPPESSFPAPMAYSFGHAEPAHPRSAASSGPKLADLSMGPAKPGPLDKTPFGDLSGINAGPDWANALSAWVRKHAYYPEQAARLGQDGDAMVYVTAEPNGKVTSVELEQKSGSPWLDMATVALFRDAHLPPLPPDDKEPLEFHFTMHYILMR